MFTSSCNSWYDASATEALAITTQSFPLVQSGRSLKSSRTRRFCRFRLGRVPRALAVPMPTNPSPGRTWRRRYLPDSRFPLAKISSNRCFPGPFRRPIGVDLGLGVASGRFVRRSCACGCGSRASCCAFGCWAGTCVSSPKVLDKNGGSESRFRAQDYTCLGSFFSGPAGQVPGESPLICGPKN